MALSSAARKRVRKDFGSIRESVAMPNLIRVQRSSYEQFLNRTEDARGDGLERVFRSVFPVKDFSGRAMLEYLAYEFESPKFDVQECIQRDLTYAARLKVKLRLIVFETDEDTGSRSIRDIKEQDVYMGDIPLMTDKGTFVVSGTERVVVSQMHRSPGVFFDHDRGRTHASGKLLHSARIIPYRGSWLDLEFDARDVLFARIDRKRKLPATVLLRALGLGTADILAQYYQVLAFSGGQTGWSVQYDQEQWKGVTPAGDVTNAQTGEVVFPAGKKIGQMKAKRSASDLGEVLVGDEFLVGSVVAADVVNMETGQIYAEACEELTEEGVREIREAGVAEISILWTGQPSSRGPWLRNTVLADKTESRQGALADIYHVIRPGEPPTLDASEGLFKQLFFDNERYDLSDVGRKMLNKRLGFDMTEVPDSVRILRKEDIIKVIGVILDLKDGQGDIDDIDNLGNRRVRSVGELLENAFKVGLVRMERSIRERLSTVDTDTVMPQDLINSKPVVASVREFFGSSQLSQFMDQTNPLSEITHKRRLSALGPGGLTRERAGFEVRDVHPTHYGRICPIETPEGPNIGLINSLATYARINRYGFIESPYRKVVDGRLTDEIDYLDAADEARYSIAQANARISEDGSLINEYVNARVGGEVRLVPRAEIAYIDVSPKQVVSVAAALIPFLENDDANRALMGSNMQRQAVPLLRAEAPIVGTGMEAVVARDSRAAVISRRSGVVEQVDATRIVVRAAETDDASLSGVDIYRLAKFQRSNQNSCINQRPIVNVGDQVEQGDIIADGPSTDLGELALGRNVLVAFMPWNGYNFEDSILVSERVVRDDVFTSIHIEEFEVSARDTKLGPEEITRDIPNVSEEALRNLDEVGIVAVGAEVEAGDILVGKVTPKGETPMTPEEKLLRAIFGEKASEVRDNSLRVPPGNSGTVVEVRIFNRHGMDKDLRALQIEREQIASLMTDRDDELAIIERDGYTRLRSHLLGKKAVSIPDREGGVDRIGPKLLDGLSRQKWWDIVLASKKEQGRLEASRTVLESECERVIARCDDRMEKIRRDDDMAPGMMKTVKVFVAVKRKLQPGDKMAGRHGNKGVISRINPVEDMPHLEDGRPVDIVLNPLGVPSRMNVGQILETHMGWACAGLGQVVTEALRAFRQDGDAGGLRSALGRAYGETMEIPEDESEIGIMADRVSQGLPVACPVFDGASQESIQDMLKEAGFDRSGQSILYDGVTGERFARPVTVGYKYLLKLHHLVDDKIHSRSTGPYSMVTQQPLGGKAQFGGQRFGEMEVWALEAYGAAYTLQEMLTFKSDDTVGRSKVFESIVRGNDAFEAGVPESFNVLVKEMRSLGLNVDLIESRDDQVEEFESAHVQH